MAKFQFYASVNLHLRRGNTTLLLRRCNTGWKDGQYGLVAGHIDGNETASQAMAREANEEAGIVIRPEDLRVIHVQHRISGREYFDLHLACDTWEGEPQNLEPDKCDDLNWFPKDALPDTIIPYIRLVFENVTAGIIYSEWREPKATE